MTRLFLPVALVLASLAAVSPVSARHDARPAAATFSNGAMTFTYPNGWYFLPDRTVNSIASAFAQPERGYFLWGAVGLAHSTPSHQGAVAILITVRLSRKDQQQLKGKVELFEKDVLDSASRSAHMRIVRRGSRSLGGQSALTADLLSTSGKPTLSQIAVALSGDRKYFYMADFVTVPASVFDSFAPAFGGIAESVRFH